MRGAISEAGVGLNLGDDERDLFRPQATDEMLAQKLAGYEERSTVEEFSFERSPHTVRLKFLDIRSETVLEFYLPGLLKKEFTARQVAALAVVMSGTLLLLSVAMGWDLSLMTKNRLFPHIIASAVQYFKWMLVWTIAGTFYWLLAFAIDNAARASWKKLAGG